MTFSFTAVWFVAGAGVCELNAMLVDTPAESHRMVTLRWLIETSLIAIRSIISHQITAKPSTNGGTRPIGLFKAATPFTSVKDAVTIQITEIDERFDAPLVLEWD